ncbi:hypothetical protein FOA52_004902 [Chlamydomonas sp. UWO 241]|nr:hypothetical protein FOA52_004902 [Chlamydomonas sp. UWO 241]
MKVAQTPSAEDKYSTVASVVNAFVESCTGGFEEHSRGFNPLHVLVPSLEEEDMKRITSDFQESTGYKVIVEPVELNDIVRELIFTEHTSPLAYDGWLASGLAVVDLVTKTTLVDSIDSFIASDTKIQWSDVTEYVREISSTYGGATIGVPISGKPLSLSYRRDVFTAANLSVPNTWEDMVLAAQILNSTDFNADGTTDFALCWQLTECDWDGLQFWRP